MEYHWPGNVRELENVIERSLVMSTGVVLDADDIKMESVPRHNPQGTSAQLPEGTTLDEYEQQIIRDALSRAGGTKARRRGYSGLRGMRCGTVCRRWVWSRSWWFLDIVAVRTIQER